MTAQGVIDRLFTAKGVTPERITKAQGLAQRMGIEWASVLNAMTEEQRKQVEANG